ncbi:hypothetical protein MPER_04454 [Moniliophthora perniciosa FA553]|nr:hypothetical protein MPER_04454 [Moniliophthora perniciosa FA553]
MEWLRQTNSTGRPFEVGRTAVNAYRAYKDASLLNVAEAMWNKAHSSVLTENNVDVVLSNFMCTDVIDVIGEIPQKNREFKDSMLGGVFSDQNRTDTYTGEDNGKAVFLKTSHFNADTFQLPSVSSSYYLRHLLN